MIPVMIMEGIDLPHMIPTSALSIMSKKMNSLMSINYDCALQPPLFLIVSELSDHYNRKTFEKIKIKFLSSYSSILIDLIARPNHLFIYQTHTCSPHQPSHAIRTASKYTNLL
jgi:hypothetical protein